MNEEKFSERLKQAIQTNNMKQSELVSKTGIPKSSISSYLSGKYIPKQTNIYKLADVLKVSPVWLMGKEAKTIEQSDNQSLKDILKDTQLESIEQLVKNDKEKKLIEFLDLFEILFLMYTHKFEEYSILLNELDQKYSATMNSILKEIKEKNIQGKNIKCGTKPININRIEDNLFIIKKNKLLYAIKKYYTKQDMLEEILRRNLFNIEDENGKSITNNEKKIDALESYLDYIMNNIDTKAKEVK